MKKILIFTFFCLSLKASYASAHFYKDDNFSLKKIARAEKNIIIFEGLIRQPLSEKFQELIKQTSTRIPLELRLHSEGGSIFETEKLIEFIKLLKLNHVEINTRVDLGSMCASSCVPLFVQGKKRIAGSASSFMFHGVAILAVTNIPKAQDSQIMIDIYREAGINENWIQEHIEMNVWSSPNETWYNGKELYVNGSQFITELLNNRIFISPYDRGDFGSRPR